jgi:DNA-binding CsgD family transcriptional regulator
MQLGSAHGTRDDPHFRYGGLQVIKAMVPGQGATLSRFSASEGVDVGRQASLGLGAGAFPIPYLAHSITREARPPTPTSTESLFAPFNREPSPSRDGVSTPQEVLAALSFGLDLVQHGAMLVAEEGQPWIANRIALEILQKKDGLWLTHTGLVTDRATDSRLLQKLLQDAIKSPELGEPKDSPLTLPRRAARNALIVRVVPGPGLLCWPGTKNRTALLKLYDQDNGLKVNAADLCRLYGMTSGEAVLAVHLARGKSLEEAAAELCISRHTARTHLKRIFMKTDTHRQAELAVRILTAVL